MEFLFAPSRFGMIKLWNLMVLGSKFKGEVMSLYRVFYKDGSFERSLCSCF